MLLRGFPANTRFGGPIGDEWKLQYGGHRGYNCRVDVMAAECSDASPPFPGSRFELFLMVRSKTQSKNLSNANPLSEADSISVAAAIAAANAKEAERTSAGPKSSAWNWIRLGILLAILIPLASFGYYRNRYTTSILRINRALENWDNLSAVTEIKKLEKTNGLTAESAFLRSRAYRHLGDDIAFAQFLELSRQLGYSPEKIQGEKLLRETQLGIGDDVDSSIAKAMALPDTDISEVGPAVVYGLLGKMQFGTVDAFLNFWGEQQPDSPWVPFFRGMIALSNRDSASAITALEKSATTRPDFLPVYRQLASAYSMTRDYDRAVRSLKRYLKGSPNDLDAIGVLATALSNLDRGDEVIELLQPMMESGKATTDMRQVLARIYSAKNEPQKVIDALSNVANLWPEDVRTANLLSQAHQALGNKSEAERYAKIAEAGQADVQSIDNRIARLLSGTDQSAEKNYELGHIFLHKQSREDGLHWLNSALMVDANHLPAHEDLVIYFTRTNQAELAARHQRYINLRKGTQ